MGHCGLQEGCCAGGAIRKSSSSQLKQKIGERGTTGRRKGPEGHSTRDDVPDTKQGDSPRSGRLTVAAIAVVDRLRSVVVVEEQLPELLRLPTPCSRSVSAIRP